MIRRYLIVLVISLPLITGCISQFTPETDEKSNMLVVQGMITNQDRAYSIKISRSQPLGKTVVPKPVKGCEVKITDDCDETYNLKEIVAGTYASDSTKFRGHVGGKYTLTIKTGSLTYVSETMEMMPAPPIDSIFYEKILMVQSNEWGKPEEGCQIYLNTYDPTGKCFFFRWDYTETWEFHLHFVGLNPCCWITQKSDNIMIKSTKEYDKSRITRYPIRFVSNNSDRLSVKYSLLVNQYSLNEDEYNFWEEIQNVSQNVGNLYDMTPTFIPGNIHNVDDPEETVLGYFSVSSISRKRIFIKDSFSGLPDLYWYCPTDTIWGEGEIEGLNREVWVLEDHPLPDLYTGTEFIRWRIITKYKECADCTTRGTLVKPSYWDKETLF
jgi:Domain of unknown function (DUF4249)